MAYLKKKREMSSKIRLPKTAKPRRATSCRSQRWFLDAAEHWKDDEGPGNKARTARPNLRRPLNVREVAKGAFVALDLRHDDRGKEGGDTGAN